MQQHTGHGEMLRGPVNKRGRAWVITQHLLSGEHLELSLSEWMVTFNSVLKDCH
jgi:hypothetical protein